MTRVGWGAGTAQVVLLPLRLSESDQTSQGLDHRPQPPLCPVPLAHSPLLAPVTMAVLPLRSTGQRQGFHVYLLFAQSIPARAKEQRNQVGWERNQNTSLAAMCVGRRLPLCSSSSSSHSFRYHLKSPLEIRVHHTACSSTCSARAKSRSRVQKDPSWAELQHKSGQPPKSAAFALLGRQHPF